MKKEISKKKKIRRLILCVMVALLLIVACDLRLRTVVYHIESDKVDEAIRVCLITDLHACRYGKKQHTLTDAVDRQNPDIVLLGGDIFDDRLSYDRAEMTIRYLAEHYKCYYVTGNHEYWSKDIDTIVGIVESYGITVLSGMCDTIEVNGRKINVCGIDDPDVVVYTKDGRETEQQLADAMSDIDKDAYTILLAHRPELIDTYRKYPVDLVLSGHAHGGQWRIPVVLNGLYAPNQGMFPEYAGGRYDFEETTMIVSRGLARESLPVPRVFNRPELVIVEIE
ncbi:MAG: metallophosphoesterase [Wujia sp.]